MVSRCGSGFAVLQAWVRMMTAVAVLALAGCGAPAPRSGAPAAGEAVPAQARLNERLAAYHRALGERDAGKMYDMSPPYVRANLSFDDFKKDLGMDAAWAALPHTRIGTRVDKACACASGVVATPGQPRVVRCLLLLDSTLADAAGKRRKYKGLEMWEYLEGEWYFGFPGGGAESCPAGQDSLD
jgi:hypothetical protein